MKVLIKKARIVCHSSSFDGTIQDIMITDGVITAISSMISDDADEIIANDNLHVSIGWMDVFAHFQDPGFEHKETIETGAAAAAAGGFTDVMILPNSNPPISNKSLVQYILQQSAMLPVTLYPIGAITVNTEGKELAEMYDMHAAGAIAFSDGLNPVQNPGVLIKALQYILPVNATVIQLPYDKSISANGLMHEGITSTRLGLPGKPAIAEELVIARDIELVKYTGSKLHITGVSTDKGLKLIAKAKEEGVNISCSVTPYHCFFCDEDLENYDTNLKVNPPLRTRKDMLALRSAVDTNAVDCFASHHIPQHWDDKACEFESARNGMIGLETMFGVLNLYTTKPESLIARLTVSPRTIFNIPIPKIEINETACLTLFDPTKEFIFTSAMIKSKSQNTALVGRTLRGKVIGIFNKHKMVINIT